VNNQIVTHLKYPLKVLFNQVIISLARILSFMRELEYMKIKIYLKKGLFLIILINSFQSLEMLMELKMKIHKK